MIVFPVLFLISLIIFCIESSSALHKIKNGRSVERSNRVLNRVRHTVKMAFMQTRVRERWWGYAHVVIFYAFLVFLLGTIELLVQSTVPGWHFNDLLPQGVVSAIHLVQTYFAGLTLIAVVVLGMRRLFKPDQIRSTADAWIILGLIAMLMVSHIVVIASNIVVRCESSWVSGWLILTPWLASFMTEENASAIHDIAASVHILCVSLFLVWIPRGKHFHIVMAFPSLFLQYRDYYKNTPVTGPETPNMVKFESALEDAAEKDLPESEWPVLGASRIAELPRNFILNAFACTQCQRCTNVCPMVAAGLGRGPMDSMIDLRRLCKERDNLLVKADSASSGIIGAQELWECTQCGACDRTCSVGVEHTSRILELRRNITYCEKMPPKLNSVFAGAERSGNPWGYSRSERTKWMESCALPDKSRVNSSLPRVLIFSGCMGAYDPTARKSLISAVKWLQKQGFDVLFMERETCCGEPLRKLGNEQEFVKCMENNLREISQIRHDIILTMCPHCAVTLRDDYASDSVHLKVLHLGEFLAQLYANHALELHVPSAFESQKIIMHMPCRLGKQPEYPRDLVRLTRALGIVIPDDDISRAHCCGAGGGQFFLDNSRSMVQMRAHELMADNPDIVAAACPFCQQMLEGELQKDDEKVKMVNLIDIALDSVALVKNESVGKLF